MLADIRLKRGDGCMGELWLVPSVYGSLARFRQTGILSKEAGGILLGYRRGPHIEVVESSAPLPRDTRRRHGFERQDPGHQALSDMRWEASGGTLTYLGEWHTHPAATPSPSPTDRHEWEKLRNFYREPLVFLIVGTERWYVELEGVTWIIESPDRNFE